MHTHKRHRHIDLDDGNAFVPDFRHGFVLAADDEAEAFGEEFIAAVTSADGMGEAARDELIEEDLNGLPAETTGEMLGEYDDYYFKAS